VGSADVTGSTLPGSATIGYRARFDECRPDATIRASALLRWAQDAAWIHSERLGFGREWYAERGLAWVVRGLDLVLRGAIPMGVTTAVTTQVRGLRRVMARRRTEIVLPDGALVATVLTDWVMTDVTRGMPTRIPNEFPSLFDVPPDAFDPIRLGPDSPPQEVAGRGFTVRPHEIDPFGHANNAVYLDWLEETVAAAGGGAALDAPTRRYRLEYLAPAAVGAELRAVAWRPDDRTWRYRIDGPGAVAIVRGSLETGGPDPAPG